MFESPCLDTHRTYKAKQARAIVKVCRNYLITETRVTELFHANPKGRMKHFSLTIADEKALPNVVYALPFLHFSGLMMTTYSFTWGLS